MNATMDVEVERQLAEAEQAQASLTGPDMTVSTVLGSNAAQNTKDVFGIDEEVVLEVTRKGRRSIDTTYGLKDKIMNSAASASVKDALMAACPKLNTVDVVKNNNGRGGRFLFTIRGKYNALAFKTCFTHQDEFEAWEELCEFRLVLPDFMKDDSPDSIMDSFRAQNGIKGRMAVDYSMRVFKKPNRLYMVGDGQVMNCILSLAGTPRKEVFCISRSVKKDCKGFMGGMSVKYNVEEAIEYVAQWERLWGESRRSAGKTVWTDEEEKEQEKEEEEEEWSLPTAPPAYEHIPSKQ